MSPAFDRIEIYHLVMGKLKEFSSSLLEQYITITTIIVILTVLFFMISDMIKATVWYCVLEWKRYPRVCTNEIDD